MMTTTASDTSDPIVTPATDTVLTLPVHLAESQSAMSAEAGTVLRYQNAAFTVPTGGAWLNVPRFQVDDWGFLGAVPVGSTPIPTPAAGRVDCRETAEN